MTEPLTELPANGPADVETAVREAIQSLTGRTDRDPASGRFLPGTLAAGTTFERSEVFWRAVADAKRNLVAGVQTDLGGAAALSEIHAGLVDGYAEARLFRQAMFLRLVDLGGPVTTKGRARALYAAYLQALDRETKLAQLLGLERRSRAVAAGSLRDFIEAQGSDSGG